MDALGLGQVAIEVAAKLAASDVLVMNVKRFGTGVPGPSPPLAELDRPARRHGVILHGLQRKLDERGLNHREMSGLSGVSTSTLARVIAGRPCTAAVAGAIGRALDAAPVCVPADLLGEGNDVA